MVAFGSFETICRDVPSYPWCNLFYKQLQKVAESRLIGSSSDARSAPVGINPRCGIPRLFHGSDLGNIANTIVAGLSFFLVMYFVTRVGRRKAAVGRIEFRWFLFMYCISLVFQILTLGSYLEQGSTALAVLTSLHAGIVAGLFWFLLANAIISTQVVEDGTPASVLPYAIFGTAFFVGTTYVALDTAFHFTTAFESNPPQELKNIALFVLVNIWPGAATVIYFVIMLYVVFVMLQEVRPMGWYIAAMILFVLSQLDVFLLSRVICDGSGAVVDGSFVATVLQTMAVGCLYLAWRSITEGAFLRSFLLSCLVLGRMGWVAFFPLLRCGGMA
ncbi:hypothetical protein EXIGLDRAFT_607098 [Exidia glandulosa HHB12029]|uniref:Uncharacterized protein n=1 Tax=Exidia glandulosa HHB12029 TaxID=1314781 RepID=A0A166B6E8_EXIGL|nr:hypothetical protein EXIGLDRAFT_607098 [Exidia glandulosa HHB12029]